MKGGLLLFKCICKWYVDVSFELKKNGLTNVPGLIRGLLSFRLVLIGTVITVNN